MIKSKIIQKHHNYNIIVEWTGNKGTGTSGYKDYDRGHTILANSKPLIQGSSDPSFLGDPSKYNPEELFLSSISSCHMLWYLHLCSTHNIVVTEYKDRAHGTMEESSSGDGRFTEVTLNPSVKITDSSKLTIAKRLHEKANEMCFIANSCNFQIKHSPTILVG